MLLWSEQFASGVPAIDEQHRRLFQHVNQLEGLLMKPEFSAEDMRAVAGFVDFLGEYIDSHFEFEETCMARHRCPAHQKNREAHQYFRQMYERFKQLQNQEGWRMEVIRELNEKINTWIQEHILRVDTQLKACVRRD